MNGYKDYDDADRLSIPTLVKYLKAFHTYYLDFQLPFIRKKLVDSLDENDNFSPTYSKNCMMSIRTTFVTHAIRRKNGFPLC